MLAHWVKGTFPKLLGFTVSFPQIRLLPFLVTPRPLLAESYRLVWRTRLYRGISYKDDDKERRPKAYCLTLCATTIQ